MRSVDWEKARKIGELAKALSSKYPNKILEKDVHDLVKAAESRNEELFMSCLQKLIKNIDINDLYDELEVEEIFRLVYELVTQKNPDDWSLL